jgi:hypothetical protein
MFRTHRRRDPNLWLLMVSDSGSFNPSTALGTSHNLSVGERNYKGTFGFPKKPVSPNADYAVNCDLAIFDRQWSILMKRTGHKKMRNGYVFRSHAGGRW